MRTVLAAVLPVALLAGAYSATAAAETKIAVIRTPALLRDAPQVRSADQKLKAQFQKREDELKTEGRKLDEDIRKFQREADTMSPQQRTTAQNDLNTRKTNFDIKQRQFGEEAQQKNAELRRAVLERVNEAIEQIAKEQGYDVVLQDPAFANSALDITDQVLKRLETLGDAGPPAQGDTGGKKKKK